MAFDAVFVDRDGTINVEEGHVYRTEDFQFIPGTLAALRRLTDVGIRIFIVSNQAGIAKGLYTESDFGVLTRYMLDKMADHGVRISGVLHCPHHPEAAILAYRKDCECRKPRAGLLLQVMSREGVSAEASAMIGDKNSDVEAGRAAGVRRTYLVKTGYGSRDELVTSADYVVADLQAAVHHLLMTGNAR